MNADWCKPQSFPETRMGNRTWDERYAALVSYKNEHGHCNVPSRYRLDTGLGRFVSEIRNGNMEITETQRDRLVALGFDWETLEEKREREWVEMFVRYKESRSTMTRKTHPKLYGWANTQRSQKSKGKLKVHRERKLNSIEFDWRGVIKQKTIPSLDMKNRRTKQWLAMYNKLLDFYHENSHAMVPRYYKKDKSLGIWVSNQREKYKDKELSDDRVRLLNDVQFVWKWDSNDASASVHQMHWDAMFDLVKDYKGIHGDAKIPRTKPYQERPIGNIGRWLATQRSKASSGRLNPLRALRLVSIGVRLSSGKESWDESFNVLQEFRRKHGHCVVPADQSHYSGLAWWIKSQKDLREKGELPEKHKALLDCLGLEWGNKSSPPKRKAGSNHTEYKGLRQVGEKHSPSVTTEETSADLVYPQETPSLAMSENVSEDAASSKRVKTADTSSPLRTLANDGGRLEDAADFGKCKVSEEPEVEIVKKSVKLVRRAARAVLKDAPERSIKIKHLRRRLRQTRGLQESGKKRDLNELLEKAISSDGKMVKRGKVITLLKHQAA